MVLMWIYQKRWLPLIGLPMIIFGVFLPSPERLIVAYLGMAMVVVPSFLRAALTFCKVPGAIRRRRLLDAPKEHN